MKPEEKTITLETMLLSGGPLRITDIETRDMITYFRIDGELFCTAGHHVYHESDKFGFDGPLIRIWAKDHKDPEGIVQFAAQMDDIDARVDLWIKHQAAYCKIVFITALGVLEKHGEKAFIKFIDSHLEATGPERNSAGEKLLKMLDSQKATETEEEE